jgi:endoglycosylceramidase
MKRVAAVLFVASCGSDDGRLPEARRCEVTAPEPGALHTEGTRIVDEQGRTVTLRGVNAGGRSKFAPYVPYEGDLDEYLDRAASWGIDVLRVPFSWNAAEPAPGAWDEAFLARYDALLDGAWARGMWTIVDFHQDVYAEPLCGDGFPSWTLADPGPPRRDCEDWFMRYDDADVEAAFDAFWADTGGVRSMFRAMWTRMIDRHAGRPGVIGYEPINEPHDGTAAPSDWARVTLTDFYDEMGALIAERDPGAFMFVDARGVDGVLGTTALERPEGDHVVFAPHSYDPGALFGWDVDPDVARRLQPWADLGAAWDVPVLIGEMGITSDHPEAAPHLRRHLDALEELGLHGTWWEYSQSDELWNFEDLSVVRGDGSDTVMVGELARPYVRALAGELVAITSWPFTLEYRAAGAAPTELAVPPRWGDLRIGAEGGCVDERDGRVLVTAEAETVRISIDPRSTAAARP